MKEEKIHGLYFDDVNRIPKIDRRDFLKKLGGGIIIVFALTEIPFWARAQMPADVKELDLNAYLRIKEDGRIDCYTGKIEMGQGVITSLAQVLADELEVPISLIDMVMGDTELCPYDAGTWGSLTTRFFDPLLRAAAAEAKAELLKLAAKKMNIPIADLTVKDAYVIHKLSDEKVSFEELTKGQKIVKTIRELPKTKTPSEFKKIGKPVISIDASVKVTGKAKYSGDIHLKDMFYISIVRPPALNSKLISVDTSAAAEMNGIKIVRDGDLIAVLHQDPEQAMIAAVNVNAKWDVSDIKVNNENIFTHILETAIESRPVEANGDLENGKKESDFVFDEEYVDGYKAHAPMETHTATALYREGKLTLWVSSQTPFGARQSISEALDIPLEKVHVKQVFIGGGFGGKIYNQQAMEAARIAKIAKVPVQLAWTREDEFQYDHFRPAAVVKISSGVTKLGKILHWDFKEYCAGARGTKLFYQVSNHKTFSYNGKDVHPIETGAWRAPGNSSTTFARESHIDVMAHKIGMDPLDFRLLNLEDKQMSVTLKAAAKEFAYNGPKSEKGNGIGIALGLDAGTRVAIIAEVKVDEQTGIAKAVRMVCAQDMGQIVNPNGARVQTEGGLTMGLGYALYEDVEFEGGKVNTKNFDRYEFTRFSTTPQIECVFIDDMNTPPQGGGEPAIICVGGAIANAIYNACGARVNQMPITPKRILQAMNV